MAWNPHYLAYADAHDRAPEEQGVHDKKRYPGGCMAGFIVWMSERRREFAADRPECVQGDRIIDPAAWTEYLKEGAVNA